MAACSPVREVPAPPVQAVAPAQPTFVPLAPVAPSPPPAVPTPQVTPPSSKQPLKVRRATQNGIGLTIVSFDRRHFRLEVVDQVGGLGSEFNSSQEAAQGGLAAINGGFFSPEGEPVGLVYTGGSKRGYFNRTSSIGTGFFLGPKASLMSRDRYLAEQPKTSHLLQSGPRLVWKGTSLTGLSNRQQRPRSFLLWDGNDHFALGYADSAGLLSLSQALKKQPFSGFQIRYALNLDGGRSCDFWVSDSVPGGGFTKKSFLNKDVRNFLVLRKSK